MYDEDLLEELGIADVKIDEIDQSEINPVTAAGYIPNHPLNDEDLTSREELQLGDLWGREGRKFESLSDKELAGRVAEARAKDEKSADDLLLIGEHAVRILEYISD